MSKDQNKKEQKDKTAPEEAKNAANAEPQQTNAEITPGEIALSEPITLAAQVEELQQELAAAEQKAQENWDKALRAQAELENLKRRGQKEVEDAHKFAVTNFAKEMLSVVDSLELGLQAVSGESEEVKKFREGSELTIKQFQSVFSKFNVVTLDPVGQPFNADQHQAMVMQEVKDVPPNTVVNVFQKGYMLNGRLLRPALVVVAKAPEQPVKTENETQA
jgi:molecular chaperone GrpE